MRISYITPTEWAESRLGFLQEAEESLAAQTLSDIEWIIISTEVAKDCLRGLVPTAFVHSPGPPLFISRLFNRGIEAADGDYLAFLDDDNRKMPDFGQEMVRFVEERGLDAAYCFARVIDGAGQEIGNHHVSTADYGFAWRTPGIYFNDELVVKREIMESLAGFDEELRVGEDYDLALRVLRDAKVGLNPVKLVDLRVHRDQWTRKDPGPAIQVSLHQILAKHGRLNARCPICNASLKRKPYEKTHVAWTELIADPGYQRFCTHPERHPQEQYGPF